MQLRKLAMVMGLCALASPVFAQSSSVGVTGSARGSAAVGAGAIGATGSAAGVNESTVGTNIPGNTSMSGSTPDRPGMSTSDRSRSGSAITGGTGATGTPRSANDSAAGSR